MKLANSSDPSVVFNVIFIMASSLPKLPIRWLLPTWFIPAVIPKMLRSVKVTVAPVGVVTLRLPEAGRKFVVVPRVF